jgi:SAM-dependent methyltransferase
MNEYDPIARIYDLLSRSVTEDVLFYVEEARRADGSVVELGVGTGRIAVPIASDGIKVIGVDASPGMLEVCAERARLAGTEIDLRLGDLREPPVNERVGLVIIPFRSLLHMSTDDDRRRALKAIRRLLQSDGRLVFDVFTPSREDIDETNGRWIEREPNIHERADWDERARTLTLTVRSPESRSTMRLAWLEAHEWRELLEQEGFEIEACYGWFDRRPFAGEEDSIWVARAPA